MKKKNHAISCIWTINKQWYIEGFPGLLVIKKNGYIFIWIVITFSLNFPSKFHNFDTGPNTIKNAAGNKKI